MERPTVIAKPERVEVGQRWKLDALDKRPHVVERIEGGTAWFDDGCRNPIDSMLTSRDWEFHGGGSPSDTGVRAAPMVALANGKPPACLFCGSAALEKFTDWACGPCITRETVRSLADAKIAWERGARDFPRRTLITDGTPVAAAAPAPKPAIDNPPPQVMSAKSLIAHRVDRLKRAEPWRPSVDEWDLLPDAPSPTGAAK